MVGVRTFIDTIFGKPERVGQIRSAEEREKWMKEGQIFDLEIQRLFERPNDPFTSYHQRLFSSFLAQSDLKIVDTQYKTEFPDSIVNSRGDVLCESIETREKVCVELKLTSFSSEDIKKYFSGKTRNVSWDKKIYDITDCVSFRNVMQLFSSMVPTKSKKGYIYYACSNNIYSVVTVTIDSGMLKAVHDQNPYVPYVINLELLYAFFQSKSLSLDTKKNSIASIMAKKYQSQVTKSKKQELTIDMASHKFGRGLKLRYKEAVDCAKKYNFYPEKITVRIKKRKRYSNSYQVVKVITIN